MNAHTQTHWKVLFILALAFITACAQVGIPTPTTFNEKVAVALTTVTAVRTSTTTLLQAKKISADDAQNVQNAANAARSGIDVSRTLAVTDPAGADNKLTAVVTALNALQSYLATKGASK